MKAWAVVDAKGRIKKSAFGETRWPDIYMSKAGAKKYIADMGETGLRPVRVEIKRMDGCKIDEASR